MTDAYLSPPDSAFACTTGDPCGECCECQRTLATARRLRRREEAEEEGWGAMNPVLRDEYPNIDQP